MAEEIRGEIPTLQDLKDDVIRQFRSRTLDEYGQNAYQVARAAWDVIAKTSLPADVLLDMVTSQTVLSATDISEIKDELVAMEDNDHKKLMTCANIVITEIRKTNPEITAEENARARSLGVKVTF